jgi:hypothetical protein
MGKDFECQADFGRKLLADLPIIWRGMYRNGCFLRNRLTFLLHYP